MSDRGTALVGDASSVNRLLLVRRQTPARPRAGVAGAPDGAEPNDPASEGGAEPIPLAAGRGTRLVTRGGAAAGGPSARDHCRLLRPAWLHAFRGAVRSRGDLR